MNVDKWESANKEYARTIVAPYLYEFDYLPHLQDNFFRSKRLAKAFNPDTNILIDKPLDVLIEIKLKTCIIHSV